MLAKRGTRLFTWVLIFEVAYIALVSILWTVPGLGLSVAATTGIANGGLMNQFITLFPLWGPLSLSWAKRRIEAEAPAASPG